MEAMNKLLWLRKSLFIEIMNVYERRNEHRELLNRKPKTYASRAKHYKDTIGFNTAHKIVYMYITSIPCNNCQIVALCAFTQNIKRRKKRCLCHTHIHFHTHFHISHNLRHKCASNRFDIHRKMAKRNKSDKREPKNVLLLLVIRRTIEMKYHWCYIFASSERIALRNS